MNMRFGLRRLKTAAQFSRKVRRFSVFPYDGRSAQRRQALRNFENSASHTGSASRKYLTEEPRLKKIREPRMAAGRTATDIPEAVVFHL